MITRCLNALQRPSTYYIAMPPGFQRALCASWLPKPSAPRAFSLILPFLYPQQRSASILSGLSDNPGAYHKKIRRGRGPSSGKGKTSGRGHKGQKQHGKVPRGFNGGQTPDEVVHGVRGFENVYVGGIIARHLTIISIRALTWETASRWI